MPSIDRSSVVYTRRVSSFVTVSTSSVLLTVNPDLAYVVLARLPCAMQGRASFCFDHPATLIVCKLTSCRLRIL